MRSMRWPASEHPPGADHMLRMVAREGSLSTRWIRTDGSRPRPAQDLDDGMCVEAIT